jgi:hypothetical protein
MDAASHEAWPVQRLARVSGVSRRILRARSRRRSVCRRIAICSHGGSSGPRRCFGHGPAHHDIAFETGWQSLARSGAPFATSRVKVRALCARRAIRADGLDRMPGCIVSAAHRPDLTIAVSEKRRR